MRVELCWTFSSWSS